MAASNSGGMSVIGLVGVVGGGTLSWLANHSIGWAMLHAIFGWFYVLYRACGYGGAWPHN